MADSSIHMFPSFVGLLVQSPNYVRKQRGETSHPRSLSLSPSSYRTPFYISGRGKIGASVFELTWRKHPVECHAGDGKHRVDCRTGTPASNPIASFQNQA